MDTVISVIFSVLLRILHDVVLHVLTKTHQSRGQTGTVLVSLTRQITFYLLMHIVENGRRSEVQTNWKMNVFHSLAKQFRAILHDFRQLLIDDELDETVHHLDTFPYLTNLSDYFKLLSPFYILLLVQWTHILNALDYTQEAW